MAEQGNTPIAEDLFCDYDRFKDCPHLIAGKSCTTCTHSIALIERCSRAEAEVAQLKAENLRLKAPVENIARSAAKEIAECFNISIPRGVSYANGILGTIKIIIETHFRGESRDALLTARTGGSDGV